MALVLPSPENPPAGAKQQLRAHRLWRDGQVHAQHDRWAQAAQAYQQAFALHGDDAYGLHEVHALIRAGRAEQAQARANALRRRRPRLGLAYTLESHAMFERGRHAEAIECLGALPADVARDHEHWLACGVALQRSGRHDEAIQAFLQALGFRMSDALTHFRLGMSFKDKGLKAEAAECVRTALTLGLGDSAPAALALLAFLEREACRWPQAQLAIAELRTAVRAIPAGRPMETGPFPHAVLVDDPKEQAKCASHYALHVLSRVTPLPRIKPKAHDGRLRIAYLSSDFHTHATAQLMAQMLEAHDRRRFEVTLVSAGPDDASPMRRRIEAACERFEEARKLSHAEIAQRIRALGIDILVDAKGVTNGTLLPVMAHRPAPVQVSWLGFPGTSGAPYIDYLIGDPIVTPLDRADDFTEAIAQMPGCYQPNDAKRALPQPSTRADWGAPAQGLLLAAFHQSYKISAEVFEAWCRVLQALPDATLWLMRWNHNVQQTLEKEAAARGIDPKRLLWAPVLPLAQHLSRLAQADVYLDAWPCNAHTTAGEALWCGVPVVTLQGRTFAQRVAASLLHAVGRDELVTTGVDGYVDTVVALGRDSARRAVLREALVAQRAAALFDGVRFAREIEALYERMWARAVAGLPPQHLPAA